MCIRDSLTTMCLSTARLQEATVQNLSSGLYAAPPYGNRRTWGITKKFGEGQKAKGRLTKIK